MQAPEANGAAGEDVGVEKTGRELACKETWGWQKERERGGGEGGGGGGGAREDTHLGGLRG
jgi:hypothetical protein